MAEDFKSGFSDDSYYKFRTIAVSLSVFLGLCGVLMGFSLFSALFGIGVFPAAPGMFFARSFGVLSLLIPAHFAYAAFILADPRWKPDRIFLLSACIFPFLTLVVGFTLIRDFDVQSMQYSFLNFTGKTGFSLIIIFLTVLEVLVLQLVKSTLFQREAVISRQRTVLLPPISQPQTEESPANPANEETASELRPVAEELPVIGEAEDLSEAGASEVDAEENNSDDSDINLSGEMLAEMAEIADLESGGDPEVDLDFETNYEDNIEIDDDVQGEDRNDDDRDDNDQTVDSVGVTRALKEAEKAAALYGEQIRKKAEKTSGSRSKKYRIPVDILNEYPDGEYWVIDQATRDAAMALKETLEEFKIQAEVTGIRKGPVITMFEILPAPGVKLSKIVGLQDNIALRLAASSVRIVAPIPGRHAVGIEVPNAKRNIVSFREIIEEMQRSDKHMEIPVVMGKDITGEAQTVDLVQMPHLLIAGATGSGKSVCVNSMILSILYQLHPSDCRLILIDPKIVELKLYNDIPHLLTPVITESKKAFQALQYCIYEMERRYACLDSMGVRDIRSYNKRIKEKNIAQEHLPYIVVVIDEFADLMATTGKELEATVARLAAKSRAIGIHLVLATQRPSIDVITGLIKANIPSRIAFMVASKMDSRIIIDMVGAEKLLGKGDMLYSGVVDPFPIRIQGAFVSEEEVEAVVEHVKSFGEPEYIDDEIFFEEEEEDAGASLFSDGEDPLYEKALEIVMQQGKASASFIQRRLKIGFNRAARLVDEMEHLGVVGPAQGSKPRELLRGV